MNKNNYNIVIRVFDIETFANILLSMLFEKNNFCFI